MPDRLVSFGLVLVFVTSPVLISPPISELNGMPRNTSEILPKLRWAPAPPPILRTGRAQALKLVLTSRPGCDTESTVNRCCLLHYL
jgi:hypothetical protein